MSAFARFTAFSIWLAAFSVAASNTTAQTNTGEIEGTVRDILGGAVPGAAVAVTHAASGLKLERVSDQNGHFLVSELPVGDYVISVERNGFKPVTQSGIHLNVGQRLTIPIVLSIGTMTDAITVNASLGLLNTANAEISEIVDHRQVVQLPLNGRQFMQLAQLTDGVAIPPGGTRGAALGQAGSLPAVYGQRSGHNIYLLDGVKVTDEYFNNLVVSPSIDAIQEFKIQKTMYPAEFGGKASALINVVTKSGGNAFHGGALAFGRSDKLDARNYFDDPTKPVPPLRTASIRREPRRPDRPRSDLLLLQLRGATDRTIGDTDLLGADGRASSGRLLGPGDPLRSGHADGRRLRAVCRQQDPLGPARSGRRGAPSACAAPQRAPDSSRIFLPSGLRSIRWIRPASGSIIGWPTRTCCMGGSPLTTSATSSRSGPASLNETLVPGFGRIVSTRSNNLALGYTHSFGPRLLNEIRFGYLERGRWAGESEPGRELRRGVGPAGRDHGSARHGVSAGVVRRPVQHHRRSNLVRVA